MHFKYILAIVLFIFYLILLALYIKNYPTTFYSFNCLWNECNIRSNVSINSTKVESNKECVYKSCEDLNPNQLNIHIVSHSHDDIGWLKTVDEYYDQSVRHIITNVVHSLDRNRNRKFTQVETYFFNRWWSEQTDQTRALVHNLVRWGQLSFANGGYTVNDEASNHYNEIIDQMTVGLKILSDLFGECGRPVISWQIDPFGASKEMAALYAQMGFDGHVVNRAVLPKGEFIWRGSADLGHKADIFTTVLHNHYSAPNGFDFENDFYFKNNQNFLNRKRKADSIVRLAEVWNRDYLKTNHVLMPFGDDFRYKNSEHYFESIDRLIEAVNEFHPNVHIFYSSPICYLLSVNGLNRTFQYRDRDYFPYWSGFFSSRPALKRQERSTNNLLQISKQLVAMTGSSDSVQQLMNEGQNEVSILTHHDAITGTSPQHTIDDYSRRLSKASEALKVVIDRSYRKLLPKVETNNRTIIPKQIFCDRLNTSECYVSEMSREFTAIIYNPIGRRVSQWIRIPVNDNHYNYEVFDSNGVAVDEIHTVPISEPVEHIPGRNGSAKYELVFWAQLERLGFNTYFINKTGKQFEDKIRDADREKTDKNEISKTHPNYNSNSNIVLKGKGFSLALDQKTGNIESIKLNNGLEFPLKQTFGYYKSNQENSYEFCSEGLVNKVSKESVRLKAIYSKGLVQEVKQEWNQWISQTIRVFKNEEYIELDWTVGPVPIQDHIGKDVIIRFETHLKTDQIFYTDANGRQNIKRIRTSDQKICAHSGNSISDNYYPICDRIFIRDNNNGMQLTILTDRAQGGSSESDGQIELMIHRRLVEHGKTWVDEKGPDGKGLVIRGKHYLFFKPINESAKLFRDLSKRLFMSPLITFAPLTESTQTEYRNRYTTSYSGLTRDLPQNIHLLTLEEWKANEILIRLEHIYEMSDNCSQLSKPIELNFQNLFNAFKIKSIREMTLTANQLLSESHRLKWQSNELENNYTNQSYDSYQVNNNNFKIQLIAQQIRTFILSIEYK